MIQENGVVVHVEGRKIWVETQRKSACESCSANKGCGTAVLNKVIGNKPNVVEVVNEADLRVGDPVVLGLDDGALVKGSFTVYMVPLLLVLAFSVIGEFLQAYMLGFASEGLTIFCAAIGLGCGYFWVRYSSSAFHCHDKYRPVVVRKGAL